MKALVHPTRPERLGYAPADAIKEPTDVVVRVDTTTICGTDLHILHGDVAAVTDGRIPATRRSALDPQDAATG